MRTLRPLLLLATTLACSAPGAVVPARCARTPPAAAQPFHVAAVEQLAGDYDVVLVDVANGYPPRLAYRIHLYVTDSARRFRSAQPYGPRHLTGWVVTNDTTLRTRYMRSQDPDRPGIVWRGAQTLSIGDNVSTLDGWGADLLGVTWHTETGFGGTWHFADTGFELVVRTDGKPYRNPSGYFCAYRVAAGA